MTPLLRILLSFPRNRLRFACDHVKRVLGRLAFYLAILGRRLNTWRRLWHGELGTSRTKPGPTQFPLPCPGARSSTHTVSCGSIGSNQNVMAASAVPASASLPIPHLRETPTATMPSECAIPSPDRSNLTTDYALRSTSASDEGSSTNRGSRNPLPSTHGPFSAGDPTTHSPAVFTTAREGVPQPTPTPCTIISDLHLPEGRFLRLINSLQISRYKKDITM
jgi:hypothetical protein